MNAKPQVTEARVSRRSLLKGAEVGAGVAGAGLLSSNPVLAFVDSSQRPSKGDVAILRLFAALEMLEADFWQQYNELGGVQDSEVPGGSGNPAYTKALSVLDSDMAQYIHDNTEDEITHFSFLNAYLAAKGAEPVIWTASARYRAAWRQAPNISGG